MSGSSRGDFLQPLTDRTGRTGKNARASPSPHHTLDQERTARFSRLLIPHWQGWLRSNLKGIFYRIWVYRLTFANCPVNISSPFIYLFFTFIFLGHGRSKRSHNITNFSSCSQDSITTTTGCLSKKNAIQINSQIHVKYNLTCTYKMHACLYIVNCYPTGQGIYICEQISHFMDYFDFCCDLVC